MAVRQQVKRGLVRTIGPDRTKQLWRIERRLRRGLAQRIDPGRTPAPTRPARPEPTTAQGSSPVPGQGLAHPESPAELASPPRGGFHPSDPFVDFPKPSASRHELLRFLHGALRPRTYLETGVASGASLALSRARSIGIDPSYDVVAELSCDVRLARTTSDEFFSRPDAVDHFDGVPVDLAFIDGMHLSEFALRDFMNVERLMALTGVILIDDMLPRNTLEAARDRQTLDWTGDVYKILELLTEQRPDLTIIPVNTSPTGTVLVLGVDPQSTTLADRYEANLARCCTPDPQTVPLEVLDRRIAADPQALMSSDGWEDLVALRSIDDREAILVTIARLAHAAEPA